MLELAGRLLAELDAGRRVAVATVVDVVGSAPSLGGTSMALTDDGRVLGSIAGGCVEGATVALCEEVLAASDPGGTHADFGVSDADAFAAGLTCGGTITVHVRLLGPDDRPALRAAAAGDEAWSLTTWSAGPDATGTADATAARDATSTGPAAEEARAVLTAAAAARVAQGRSGRVAGACDDVALEGFVEVRARPARLLLYGALELSAAVAVLARTLGWRVTVCDPRSALATADRLPAADEVVVDWPVRHLAAVVAGPGLGPRDAVCVLVHDDRFDTELVLAALRSGAGFVGALGSRRTHGRRVAALVAAGATPAEVAALHSPVGLDLGAATPQETAVSVVAGLLAARTGRTGRPLVGLEGPLHGPAPDVRPAPRPVAQPDRQTG
ncbi:hypothetical protein Cma02nite_22830 [Cellulomonas marina]|nr:hypothetical protein Cma02nite_22830 [Cellulomonas marina]